MDEVSHPFHGASCKAVVGLPDATAQLPHTEHDSHGKRQQRTCSKTMAVESDNQLSNGFDELGIEKVFHCGSLTDWVVQAVLSAREKAYRAGVCRSSGGFSNAVSSCCGTDCLKIPRAWLQIQS
jgi:hypothetical protein